MTVPAHCPTPQLHGIPIPSLDYCANCIAPVVESAVEIRRQLCADDECPDDCEACCSGQWDRMCPDCRYYAMADGR